MAGLVLSYVSYETVPVTIGRNGYDTSIGEQVDRAIVRALADGLELQTVSVELSKEDWAMLRNEAAPQSESIAVEAPVRKALKRT